MLCARASNHKSCHSNRHFSGANKNTTQSDSKSMGFASKKKPQPSGSDTTPRARRTFTSLLLYCLPLRSARTHAIIHLIYTIYSLAPQCGHHPTIYTFRPVSNPFSCGSAHADNFVRMETSLHTRIFHTHTFETQTKYSPLRGRQGSCASLLTHSPPHRPPAGRSIYMSVSQFVVFVEYMFTAYSKNHLYRAANEVYIVGRNPVGTAPRAADGRQS